MTYKEALDFLFVRTTGQFKFGLERTRELLAELGDPHTKVPAFHVAGTNGKGSTVAMIAALLRFNGLRTGVYTSPHLIDFRERIAIDDTRIPADEVVEFVKRWTPTVERIGASFFEATTAMAFAHFASRGAEAMVIETGLGGRLDSTNVVDPLVAVVTSIGVDHTEYLGGTLSEIAMEKAGIFKPGRAAVIGEQDPSVRDLLAARARELGVSETSVLDTTLLVDDVAVSEEGTCLSVRGTRGRPGVPVRTRLIGAHQARNAALALMAVNRGESGHWVDARNATEAFDSVRVPGRFDRRGKYVFDVAHNVDGIRVLVETLAVVDAPRPRVAVLSVLADKDWRGMIQTLAPSIDHLVITNTPTAPASRAWSLETVHRFATGLGVEVAAIPDLEVALRQATEMGETAVVTGSFHTVGDAMVVLGMEA